MPFSRTASEILARSLGLAPRALRGVRTLVKLPCLALLLVFEPLVRGVLSVLAVLGVVLTLVIDASGAARDFPFWGMLGASVACAVAVLVYQSIVRWLAR